MVNVTDYDATRSNSQPYLSTTILPRYCSVTASHRRAKKTQMIARPASELRDEQHDEVVHVRAEAGRLA
jgi:hypothetical protein